MCYFRKDIQNRKEVRKKNDGKKLTIVIFTSFSVAHKKESAFYFHRSISSDKMRFQWNFLSYTVAASSSSSFIFYLWAIKRFRKEVVRREAFKLHQCDKEKELPIRNEHVCIWNKKGIFFPSTSFIPFFASLEMEMIFKWDGCSG